MVIFALILVANEKPGFDSRVIRGTRRPDDYLLFISFSLS